MEKEEKFESKMKRLEDIVAKVESESLSLGQSVPLFEEGMELIKELNEMLANVEEKIVNIIEKN